MSHRSLEDLLTTAGNPVELLRNSPAGPNVYPGVPPEFTNWRDEQRAWQETCVLFDQSFHMNDLAVEGPDALELLSQLAVNSFDGFGVGRAKHFVPCSPDGYVIGDVILFALGWRALQPRRPGSRAQLDHLPRGDGGYDVTVELDLRTALRTDGRRRFYRFQVQGPNAMQVIEKALGVPPPELKFFHTTTVTIAGKSVGALRHGMVGQPGWELFGPWDDGEAVREALLAAGEEFGLEAGRWTSVLVQHARVRLDPIAASGRVLGREHEGLPRVAAGDRVRGIRVDRRELHLRRHRGLLLHAVGLGYGSYVKFDHDFVGREALEEKADGDHRTEGHAGARRRGRDPHDRNDVPEGRAGEVHGLALGRLLDAPVRPRHGQRGDGRRLDVDRLQLERGEDADPRRPGRRARRARDRRDVVWGEDDGGTAKPTVEPHVQVEIGAVVSPVPYVEAVRKSYAPGSWRASQA